MATGRTPLMAGNWKMNLDHLQATHLVQKLDWTLKDGKHDFGAVEVAVLPPFTDLRSVQTLIDGDRLELKYGAQDLSVHDARRLHRRDQRGLPRQARLHLRRRRPQRAARVPRRGRRRRQRQGARRPTSTASPRSSAAARASRSARPAPTSSTCSPRSRPGSTGSPSSRRRTLVVAYEPIWAIGTGEVATPEDAQEVCAAIRTKLAELYSGDVADGIRVLYGGSVKSGNVAAIMAKEDVDGALVGGASIDPVEFAAICRFHDHLETS